MNVASKDKECPALQLANEIRPGTGASSVLSVGRSQAAASQKLFDEMKVSLCRECSLVPLTKAAKMLGVTSATLRAWDAAGKIKTVRTVGGHRRVPMDEILRLREGVKKHE